MESRIVEELRKTRSISNRLLANRIDKRQKSNTFRVPQDVYIENLNSEKAYKLFLKLLSQEDRKKIMELDRVINSIEEFISEKSGWWMTGRTGFMLQDNFVNMHDHEFRSFDTYRIYRNEDGFYVSNEEPFNSYFAGLRAREIAFYEKYKDKLEILHNALSSKEEMMLGNYNLKDEKDRTFVAEIARFLGYKKKEKVKKYK